MNAISVKIFTLIIAFMLFSSFKEASDNLAQKLEQTLKIPSEKSSEQLHALTIQFITHVPIDSIENNRKLINAAISRSNFPYKDALIYEVEAYSAKSLLNLADARLLVKKAIGEPNIPERLLLRLLTLLAYIETDLENYLGAVENYQVIEKLLIRQKNNHEKLAVNYMGLADLYLKTGLYREAVTR
ncbi:MAG: hypothetical protein EOP00_22770 [Pedobacter sp.]|nr:MAG: hypothetical protein EOP00_22770 [Pedobacter sp.]